MATAENLIHGGESHYFYYTDENAKAFEVEYRVTFFRRADHLKGVSISKKLPLEEFTPATGRWFTFNETSTIGTPSADLAAQYLLLHLNGKL